MYALKLTQIGNSYGWILPKEMLGKLKLEKGDCTYATESSNGMRITVHNPVFSEQMTVARAIMKRRRQVLHELAK